MDEKKAFLSPDSARIVFFDGICNLCNSSVNFIIDRDSQKKFRFAALDSNTGKRVLSQSDLEGLAESVLLWENGILYKKSSAVLHIALRLSWFWPIMGIFLVIPPFIRDFFYDVVAKNRYAWFGKTSYCRVMTPALRDRFLN